MAGVLDKCLMCEEAEDHLHVIQFMSVEAKEVEDNDHSEIEEKIIQRNMHPGLVTFMVKGLQVRVKVGLTIDPSGHQGKEMLREI